MSIFNCQYFKTILHIRAFRPSNNKYCANRYKRRVLKTVIDAITFQSHIINAVKSIANLFSNNSDHLRRALMSQVTRNPFSRSYRQC